MKPLPEDAWNAWQPADLMKRLGLDIHWYVVGGWALDLWHGRQTRDHEDLEFSVLQEDVDRARSLLGELVFFSVADGHVEHLPSSVPPAEHVAQLWGADPKEGCWRVDMMPERGTAATWVYKRDPSLTVPRGDLIRRTAEGLPFLAPAAILLFKAKHRREKDERDFDLALPRLAAAERADLRGWLSRLHPDHDWIARL
ncbi:nucleotidyltransferase domain-containing protein [Rhizobium sp. NPDC090279]|uniref:nucleotidyltransferase domain-containing protein n=1 Tax=Rhizobium sp. NPDC090279 TaxID=3364499 RepID=UPI003839D0D6